MGAQVTVVAGPACSGKTAHLLDLYRGALQDCARDHTLEGTLWLAPSRRAVEQVRERLLRDSLSACFAPGITTFAHFADRVLDFADDEIRPIDARSKRLLVEQLLQEAAAAGRLKHFGGIAHTPGLVDLVVEFISELKRDEIWPEDFAHACDARGAGQSRKDRELGDLYRRYQDLLVKHRLYDDEGRFWSARDRLQRGQQRPYEHLRIVVVDGFTDLTRTQHEIVDLLARRVEQIYVGLVDDERGDRDDLFLKPRGTLARLQKSHPQLKVRRLPAPAARPTPALRAVERSLFLNPRKVRPSNDAAGLEIIAASGRVGEIEEIARRIKRLLLEGDAGRRVRPDDVGVVFRSLGDAAPLVRETFARFGLPTAVESGERLDQSPALSAMFALLQLDADDWPYRELLTTTGGNYFAPNCPDWHHPAAREAVEATIRTLQLPAGRAELLERLEEMVAEAPRAIEPGSPTAEADARFNDRREAAVRSLPIFRRLATAFDALPRKASAGAWSQALRELASATGLYSQLGEGRRLAEEHPNTFDPDADFAAWERFHKVLQTSDRLAELLGVPPREYDRSELPEVVREILRTEQMPGPHDESGRVRVLSIVSARSLSFPYLFLAGLTEKSFPSSLREDRLYGDVEYRQFIQSGLRLTSADERFADEMLFFYEAATRAERRLTLSFAALNDKAEPLLPSPYLVELEGLFAKDAIRRTEITDLSPVPQADAIVTPAQHRIRAVAEAMRGSPGGVADLLSSASSTIDNLAAGLRGVYERGHGREFGPYEGVFADHEALRAVGRRFDSDFPWSAGQLEQYGQCPYQFFLERVLKLREAAEAGLEIDHGRRGSRLHDLLAQLHARLNEAVGGAALPSEVDAKKLLRWIDELVQSVEADDDGRLSAALTEIDRRLLRRWLEDYAEQHAKYEATYEGLAAAVRPAHFEASFGMPNPPADGISSIEPLLLTDGRDEIRISGRIDRIDVGEADGRTVFGIIDYKSGSGRKYTKNHVLSGRALQLTLYAVAAERLLTGDRDAVPWQFGYWFVADAGFKKTIPLQQATAAGLQPSEEWTRLREDVVARVLALVRGVRRGEFPMHNSDDKCGEHCRFRTVCRVAQVRALEKSWQPPTPARD